MEFCPGGLSALLRRQRELCCRGRVLFGLALSVMEGVYLGEDYVREELYPTFEKPI